jgi:integrase/recombinase XerD
LSLFSRNHNGDLVVIEEGDLELYAKHKGTTCGHKHVIRCELLVRNFLEAQGWKVSYQSTLDQFNAIREQFSPKKYRDTVLFVRDFLRFMGLEWCNRIKLPRVPKRLPVYVKPEQIARLLAEIEKLEDPQRRQQLKAFTLLGMTTGMRSEEMYRLTPDVIDLKSATIQVRNTKSGLDRLVFLNEPTKKEISKLLEMDEQPLFQYRVIQRFYERMRSQTSDLLPKHLRKFFSAESDRRGLPTGVKKRLMGHSINGDIDLLHYSALAFDDLKAIYERYWGEVRIESHRIA